MFPDLVLTTDGPGPEARWERSRSRPRSRSITSRRWRSGRTSAAPAPPFISMCRPGAVDIARRLASRTTSTSPRSGAIHTIGDQTRFTLVHGGDAGREARAPQAAAPSESRPAEPDGEAAPVKAKASARASGARRPAEGRRGEEARRRSHVRSRKEEVSPAAAAVQPRQARLRKHVRRPADRRRGKGAHRHPVLVPHAARRRVGRAPLDEEAIRLIEQPTRTSSSTGRGSSKGRPTSRASPSGRREPRQRRPRKRRVRPSRRSPKAADPRSRRPIPDSPDRRCGGRCDAAAPRSCPEEPDVRRRRCAARVRRARPAAGAICRDAGRITERIPEPDAQEELKTLAERLNPDAWVTEREVSAGLEEYEAAFESLRSVVGASRRRRRPPRPSHSGRYSSRLYNQRHAAKSSRADALVCWPCSSRLAGVSAAVATSPQKPPARRSTPQQAAAAEAAAAGAARSDPPQRRPGHHRRHRPRQPRAVRRRPEEGRVRGLRRRRQAGCRLVRADARRPRLQPTLPPPPPVQEGIILPPARPTNDAAGRIFIIFVDDLHLDFRNTGRIRDLFKKISTELIHEGDMFAIVSTGPSSIAIELDLRSASGSTRRSRRSPAAA